MPFIDGNIRMITFHNLMLLLKSVIFEFAGERRQNYLGKKRICKRGADVESAPLGYVVSKSVVYFTSSKIIVSDYQTLIKVCRKYAQFFE
jgi:hypothetical protein